MTVNFVSLIKRANRQLLEQGKIDAVEKYFSSNYVAHITGKDVSGGHALIRQIVSMYQQAFSGISTTLDILAQQDDRVAWQRTVRATHRGAFKGFPATNRPIMWREMVTSRFDNGLIVEEWFITDLAEQLLLARKSLRK